MAELTYKAPPTIGRMLQSRAFIQGIIGPLGSGKSVGCCMKLLYNAMQQEPSPRDGIRRSRYVIIRNTFRMLNDTTIKTVHEWLPPGIAGKWKDSTKTLMLKFGDVESEWLFRPLESPDDVRNLLSLEVTGAWINEYREIDPDVLVNLLGRVGRSPRKADTNGRGAVLRSIVMDSNPPPQGSYWHDLFEEAVPEEIQDALEHSLADAHPDEQGRPLIEYFRQPSGRSDAAENVENLPAGYYDLLVAANAHRGEEWVKVHVDAEYGADPSNLPVYPEFRPDLHAPAGVTLTANPRLPLLLGMDFGRTPAAVVLQDTPDGYIDVLREFLMQGVDIAQFVSRLIPWLQRNFPEHSLSEMTVYGDPAGQHRSQNSSLDCFTVLRSRGFTVLPGVQNPDIRIGSVRYTMVTLQGDRPILRVDRAGCPVLYRGLAGRYAYKVNQEGEINPQPKKNDVSHPNDALQYPLAALFGQALKANTARGKLGFDKPVTRFPKGRVFS